VVKTHNNSEKKPAKPHGKHSKEKKVKILHLADVHIDEKKTVNGKIIYDEEGINIRLKDLLDCISQVKNTAEKENVSLTLIAGDLFERKTPTPFETYTATKVLSELSSICPVVLTPGNHDAVDSVKALGFIKNIYVPEPFTPIRFSDITIFCVPYPDLKEGSRSEVKQLYERKILETSKKLKENSNFLVALCHAPVEGASYPTTDRDVNEVTLSPSCFKHLDYAALGHIHKPQRIENIYYPGSVDTWRRQEADEEKGFYIIDTDTHEVTFYPITTRPVHNLNFTIDTIPLVINVLEQSIVRIEIEVPEERAGDYDPVRVQNVIAGNPLDVKIIPRIIRTQRMRCQEIVQAKNFDEIITTYMKNKKLPEEKINRIREKIMELVREKELEAKLC